MCQKHQGVSGTVAGSLAVVGRARAGRGPGRAWALQRPPPRPAPSPAQPRPSANPGGVGSLWACTFPSVDCGRRVRFPSSHGGDLSMTEASEGCSRGFRARQPCAAPRGAAEPRPRATSQSPGRVPRSASACADSLPCSLQGGVSSVPETGLPLLLRTARACLEGGLPGGGGGSQGDGRTHLSLS